MFENIDLVSAYSDLGMIGIVLFVLAYFIYKDFTLNKVLNESLNKFTVALNVLIGKLGD